MARLGALLVAAGIAAAGGIYAYTRFASKAQLAWLVGPQKQRVTAVRFEQGAARTLSTVVPQGSVPVSVQAFRTNPDGSITESPQESWSIDATGYNYEITATNVIPLGNYSVYTVVLFSDGTQAKSNTVTMTIIPVSGGQYGSPRGY